MVHDTVVPQKMGASISAEPRLALVSINRAEIGECGGWDVISGCAAEVWFGFYRRRVWPCGQDEPAELWGAPLDTVMGNAEVG